MADRKDDEDSPKKKNSVRVWVQSQNIKDERASPHHRLTQRRLNAMSEQIKNYWALRKVMFNNARMAAKSLRRAGKYMNLINNVKGRITKRKDNNKKRVQKTKKQYKKAKPQREPTEFNPRTENTRAWRARRAARRAGRYHA